ncbi:hypothetical protein HNQ59_002366 [Chitinivorax tropicus]|uniref:Uncharacterized protein n=1 Tax=Chitinivorax tropicus TaxID=714531 RepID=A0A840MK88_9PROT|nr:hypothetical protein [Chitinivorax tropicus]MBB5019068.1 hypothetical protein [Chitinivorax tropicus]
MSSSTESLPTAGNQRPTPAMMRAIMKSTDDTDQEGVAACLGELSLPQSALPRLFLSTPLPTIQAGERKYFVRPALAPYCQTFYGAHLFRFWLINAQTIKGKTQYQVLFSGIGDVFEVLSSTHHQQYDLIQTNCTASSCIKEKLQFNGQQYQAVECRFEGWKEGKEQNKLIPCQR